MGSPFDAERLGSRSRYAVVPRLSLAIAQMSKTAGTRRSSRAVRHRTAIQQEQAGRTNMSILGTDQLDPNPGPGKIDERMRNWHSPASTKSQSSASWYRRDSGHPERRDQRFVEVDERVSSRACGRFPRPRRFFRKSSISLPARTIARVPEHDTCHASLAASF